MYKINKNVLILILLAVFLMYSNPLLAISPMKLDNYACESDVYMRAINNCITKATTFIGHTAARTGRSRIGVLIIRDLKSGGQTISSFNEKFSGWHHFLMTLPIIGFFERAIISPWSSSSIAFEEGRGRDSDTLSRNVAVEDVLISKLNSLNQFLVIETIQPFYSQIEKLTTGGQPHLIEGIATGSEPSEIKGFASGGSLPMAYLKNPMFVSQIGKVMNVDTMLIGSTLASANKVIVDDNFWRTERYFVSKYTLHLRAIDVATNSVMSSNNFTGSAARLISRDVKLDNIVYALSQLAAIVYFADDSN